MPVSSPAVQTAVNMKTMFETDGDLFAHCYCVPPTTPLRSFERSARLVSALVDAQGDAANSECETEIAVGELSKAQLIKSLIQRADNLLSGLRIG